MEGSQRRLLLAFLLMAAVFGASQWWYARHAPPRGTETAEEAGAPGPSGPTAPGVAAPGEAGPREAASAAAGGPATLPSDTGAAAAGTGAPADTTAGGTAAPSAPAGPPVVVETPLYRVIIDPRGGAFREVELRRYPSFAHSGSVRLVPEGGAFLSRTVEAGSEAIALGPIDFTPSDSAIRLAEGDSARTLELRGESGGRAVVQRYRFQPDTYAVDYELDVGRGDGVLHTVIGPRLESNEKNPRDDYGALRAVARIDGEVVTRGPKDAGKGDLAFGGEIDWTGLRNKYFLAVILEPEGGPALSASTMRGAPGDSVPVLEVRATTPLREGTARYRIFMGPQEFRRLRALDHGLDDVNQYGWSWIRWLVTPFAKIIVVAMLWLHRWIPDYGLVLIVFGVLVRLIMWPLTTKSFRSIQQMQKLQPEIQRIREVHKQDPQRMQQETMRLYRERKVNPLGGCLPNLIPMPILFALFFVFQSTIEFRGAPFLWLPDLSQPDPYYILPILMGLTMLISSRLTQTDPKMAAMTYVMPVVLTFVFINLAAGLVLYYTVSNVLTFGQQWWLRREMAAAVAPAPS